MSQITVDDITYVQVSAENLEAGTKPYEAIDKTLVKEIVISSYVSINNKNHKVTVIGTNSFSSTNITGVVIPDTINIIKYNAFGYSYNLKYIVIKGNMPYLESWAIANQRDLTNITYCGSINPEFVSKEQNSWAIASGSSVKVYVTRSYKENVFSNKNVIKKYLPYCPILEHQCFCISIKMKDYVMKIFTLFEIIVC